MIRLNVTNKPVTLTVSKAKVVGGIQIGGNAGVEYAGMLLYVDAAGKYSYLTLGAGLTIKDGVLMLDETATPDEPEKPDTTIAVLSLATLGTMVLGNGG